MEAKVILTLHENEVNNRMKNFKLKNADELKGVLKNELSVLTTKYPKIWKNLDVVVEEDKKVNVEIKCDNKLSDQIRQIQMDVYEFLLNSSTRKGNEQLQRDIEYYRGRLLGLEVEKNNLKISYDLLKSECATTCGKLDKENEELKEENSKVKEDNSKLAGEILELQDELRLAEDELKKTKDELVNAINEKETLDILNKNLLQECADYDKKVEELKKENKALVELNRSKSCIMFENDRLQKELDALAHTVYKGDEEIIHCVMTEVPPTLTWKDGKRYSMTEVQKIVHDIIAARDAQYKVALENFFEDLGYDD